MNTPTTVTGILIEEHTTYTVVEVCQKYNISEELLAKLVEYGLFHTNTSDLNRIAFNTKALQRMEAAFRLHRDLGVNLEGVILALELLDEIHAIENELQILRKQV